MRIFFLGAALGVGAYAGSLAAQENPLGQTNAAAAGVTEARHVVRIGARIQSAGRPVSNMLLTLQVPNEWPEQHVSLYQENLPSELGRSQYRDTATIRQFVATVPRLPAQSPLEFEILFDVTVKAIPYPERTGHLLIPERPPREIRQWLAPGKFIESRKPAIRKKAEFLTAEIEVPWEKCRALHAWVTDHLEIDGPESGAADAIENGKGSVEDRSYAFIALCRSIGIPARMVWADGGEYTEFWLQDEAGNGQWFPAVVDSKPEFGKMSKPRVILQKGENIKVPEWKEPQLYVVETVSGNGQTLPPEWICDVLQAREVR